MTTTGLVRATVLAGCAGLVAVGLASIVIVREADARGFVETSLPAGPAFSIPAPVRLDRTSETSRWASVRHATRVLRRPAKDAGEIATLDARTPEGTANVVLVSRYQRDRSGVLWARILGPGEKLSTRWGWVNTRALGTGGVSRARLIIDRRALTATLERSGRATFNAKIGVGVSTAPTPAGRFYIRNALTRYASPKYGPIAFGTSAQSTATDWPGGGFVGIHGTDQPDLLPGRVSQGCIRMANGDIRRLAEQLEVGTPVVIV